MRFNLSELDAEFKKRLLSSAKQLGIIECGCDKAIKLVAKESDKAYTELSDGILTVNYTQKYEFFYGVKSFLASPASERIDIECSFGEFGVMLDCSRNAVRTVATLKKFIDNLALMGYNQLQLYTEDTYEIEGEKYFGYQRGRYSIAEIKEIDAYAAWYGIELVPCIQTLAHLNQIFRWRRYDKIRDIDSVLMIGDEATYEFIDTMFKSVAKTFSSKKLHIGLDEAHNVGRGRYLDKNGYRPGEEIMCEHINRVVEIAKKYGFEPMMWSDMFFRLANNGRYYVGNDAPPLNPEVAKLIPEGLRLVYWDYYQDNQAAYENMMDRSAVFQREIVFAGGAWSWRGFAPRNKFSDLATNHAFNACRAKGIKNVFLTMWGDDGAECSPFATLSSLSFASDYAYGVEDHENSFFALTSMKKDDFLLLDAINDIRSEEPNANCLCKVALYNDVFLGVYDTFMDKNDGEKFANVASMLQKAKEGAGEYSYIFETLYHLARVLEYKGALGLKTRYCYKNGDKAALKSLAKIDYKKAIVRLEEFYKAFKAQWCIDNKSFGFEVQALRIGGLIRRLKDCRATILDYVKGKVEKIEELECEIINPVEKDNGEVSVSDIVNSHRILASTSVI